MSQIDLDAVGNSRESWCAVELNKSQSWCRTERKHYRENFESSVFSPSRNIEIEERCQWKIEAPTHRERRHFEKSHVYELKF